jgi:hypothetical protein
LLFFKNKNKEIITGEVSLCLIEHGHIANRLLVNLPFHPFRLSRNHLGSISPNFFAEQKDAGVQHSAKIRCSISPTKLKAKVVGQNLPNLCAICQMRLTKKGFEFCARKICEELLVKSTPREYGIYVSIFGATAVLHATNDSKKLLL